MLSPRMDTLIRAPISHPPVIWCSTSQLSGFLLDLNSDLNVLADGELDQLVTQGLMS